MRASRSILENMQKPLSALLSISLRDQYYFRVPMDPVASSEKNRAGTRTCAMNSRSHHDAQESRSDVGVFFAEHVARGSGPIHRNVIAVCEVNHSKAHVFGQSRTCLQVMQVFQLVERSILGEALLSQGYI